MKLALIQKSNNSMKFKIITIQIAILILFVFSGIIYSQPELDVQPNRIEFQDLFNRLDHTFLINKGNQILTIDSIDYNHDDYIIEFEGSLQLPFTILPDDSVKMSVTLSAFYNITINDSTDTMYIYNDGIGPIENLQVRIRFFEDDFGTIKGTIRDTISPLENANVYFLYNGIYLLNSVTTNSSGFYQATLPQGDYTIAAEKDGYFVQYYDSTYDPNFAKLAHISEKDSLHIDFTMRAVEDTSYYISGNLYDSLNAITIDRGIVIIRGGTHVPINKPGAGTLYTDTLDVVSGFIKPDGSFKVNVQQPIYYYVQAYTNYFLPGYYNDEGNASVYWQNADTVLIDTSITNKNIYLVRDSSYGGGNAAGNIAFNFNRGTDNYYGITLYAKSLSTNALYSYNFGKDDGSFKVTNLPYGQYQMIAQRIGIDDAYSQIFTIDPLNPNINGINIVFDLSDVQQNQEQPTSFILYPNYPNPFNPSTTISFYVPQMSELKISIINILGEKVSTLNDETFSEGLHKIIFDAKGLSSGVYFVLFEAPKFVKTQKILLLK
jgi:Secretion system C-terminal sorting domain/Carboxypeptidase regulatory-like domain